MGDVQSIVLLLLNIDIYGNDNSNNKIKFTDILDDSKNLNLIRKYFYDEKYISDLLDEIEKIASFTESNYVRLMESIFNMYPFSKKFLEYFIKRKELCSLEHKVDFILAEEAFLSSLNHHLDSLYLFMKNIDEDNIKDEIKEVKKKYEKKKISLSRKLELEKKKKEVNKLLEDNGVESAIQNLENEIKEINFHITELENIYKIKKEEKETLLKHFEELKLNNLEKEENILIKQLSDLWFKSDIEVSYD